jgi:hypothetical protein
VTIGLDSQCLSCVTVSGKIITYRFHYLLLFCHVVDSVATLTTDVSVFGLPSVGDKSLGMEAAVRIKIRFYQGWKLTTQDFMYLYIGPPEQIHHHVWFKGF